MKLNIADIEFQTCAEELMYLLFAHGVEYLFLNPGTDSAPLQEAAASLLARDLSIPKIVTCSFESVALAAAHGFWQRSGRPQAVFVHVDVGTQNLGAMVHNILRDGGGVLVLAGKTPYSENIASAGSRSSPIHWQQDVADQSGIVRGYAKWTYELVRSSETSRVIGRAIQIAAADVAGLAYLMISRDVLMDPAEPASTRRITRFARPEAPAMSKNSLSRVVDLLQRATHPVIIVGRINWPSGDSRDLASLSDLCAIPIIERVPGVNLPTSHPMSVRDDAEASSLISEADLLLIIECDVPWIPSKTLISSSVTIVQIDSDPIKSAMPLWTFPVDIAITASAATAVHQLANALEEGFRRTNLEVADRSPVTDIKTVEKSLENRGSSQVTLDGLSVQQVIEKLNELLRPEDLVVLEAVSNNSRVLKHLERSEPGTICTSGGPGLGWALGASVGIKLAEHARRVIAIVGDGAFMFGVPTSALCLAAEVNVSFLVIVLNNNGYRASRLPVFELFPDGVSTLAKEAIGTRFICPPSLASVAEACGAYGRKVTDIRQLLPELRNAFEVVESGRVAVVDIQVNES